ncbi:MAG: sigma 54-interacting transcriptional regulator [Gracilibacteraceae bacterium]|nr:sigma 54-interacting transcriptional regulator [Gracilibacteraceae bacterium]
MGKQAVKTATIDELALLRAENRELRKMNELLMTVVDNIRVAVYAVNEKNEIVIYNSETERTEHKIRSEMIGRDEREVYTEPFFEVWTRRIKEQQKPLFQETFHFTTNNGLRHSIIADGLPFFFEGQYAGAITISHDLRLLNEELERLRLRAQLLSAGAGKTARHDFRSIISKCAEMDKLIAMAQRAAVRDIPVMLTGETGTGKELFAQAIHSASARRGLFVPINCASIPDTLLESILFGSVKGAFTGATDVPGLFEQAEGGSIFLDEIDSMAPSLQAKLLRVLQEKKVRRVGALKEISVNCRVISAGIMNTPRNLRSDLFFRLAVVLLKLPPLRERPEDVKFLARAFVEKYNRKYGVGIRDVDPALNRLMQTYSWPGNVRELENLIECAMVFVEPHETVLAPQHVPDYYMENLNRQKQGRGGAASGQPLQQRLQEYEKQMITDTLARNSGNISQTAKELGLIRQSLQAKIKRCGVNA